MRLAFLPLALVSSLVLTQNPFLQDTPGLDKIDGTIGDSTCGLSHTVAPGLGAAGCTRYCVVRGAHYILISGQRVYQLTGDPKLLDQFAGVPRTLIGHRDGDTFHVMAVASE
jgi:hypothetical protein